MLLNGLLPIGSVVLLKNGTKRVMIAGVCQNKMNDEKETLYDYVGCLFPEGYLDSNQMYLFNNEQIEKLYFIGYQDDEQLRFKMKADEALERLRKEEGK